MEMQFKNEIKKLTDVVEWADGIIRDAGYNEEKYQSDGSTAYCHVKAHELWRIRDVALESMERHTVYTNALNKDIADKAAKIELLEKEIEGRKEGYIALKERMDTRYISIKEHNNICEDFKKKIAELEKELADRNVKIRHQKENLDGINKTLEIRTKENESLIAVRNNLNKEIEAHESENKRLSDRIIELKKENSYLKKELNETCTCKELDLKGHNRREMTLVDELAKKNDEIKELKKENSYLKSEIKQKQNIIKKAYERYSDEILKTRKELMEVAYHEVKKDNGYIGFKLYVENTLREAKGNKEEANEVITNAVKFFYREWDKEQKENEKTIEKAINEVKSKSGTPDIPCGEDSIE